MRLPSPEICQRILALHLLLGFADGKDEKRIELLELLSECGLGWNSLPEFFADMKVNTATPLPVVDSNSWKKRCQKVCQLHAAMGSSDKDGLVAHRKLIEWLAKQQFTWSSDLPAILAADWIFRNPPFGNSTATSAPEVDVFGLTKAVLEDRIVLLPASLVAATLIALNCHTYEQFAHAPQLGIIAPKSGCGKTTLLTALQRLVARPWASKHASAPAIYRHLRRQPRSTLLLDGLENQNLTGDSTLRSIIETAYEGGSKDLVEDGESIKIEIHAPVIWAIRGAIRDVPLSMLSRGLQIHMRHGTPRIKLRSRNDPKFFEDLDIAHEEILKFAATCSLDPNPDIPVELRSDEARLDDVCRPLLSVADSLGHGVEARAALIELCAVRPPQDDGMQALKDAKIVFEALEIDRIFKRDLAPAIVQYGDPMWGHYHGPDDREKPHELRSTELASLFGRFHVYSKTVWPEGPRRPGVKSKSGYYRSQFEKAWAEHCSDPVTPSQPRKIIPLIKP
jgi:hypothetical protein